ncbi:Hypothetical Protein FCC1311_081331 [Hondaea fermentalgiana]|uniref:PhoD-like phosphatase metallophosphatase domain-containing protein n=1 Tax=Hondaea fermentalgiana TaxID=2315210 RepID=A0A2R5GY04_9STRA|nr:Hypothetical Protein FCC1311_081331 [Hondaea fermentalgiana]|eukprot:GBG32854.1 Hypothetical Protein FCC1311_081331 [Hondaea fermentalgiana]
MRRAWLLALTTVSLAIKQGNAVFADLRLAPDREHAPFLHGVASADPLTDSVLLWTRITTENATAQVRWALWDSSEGLGQSFEAPLAGGLVTNITADDDYTLTVTVDGLAAAKAYVYQFEAEDGSRSVLGKTRTASAAGAENVTLAFTSCSSVWSGHFNHYRAIANDDSLEFWVHLGDYIYPEIDVSETYRVPKGLCEHTWFEGIGDLQSQDPSENEDAYVAAMVEALDCDASDLELYRWVQAFYLLDPDLRAARAAHPVIVSFDNHDLADTDNALEGSRKAAFEWVPQRHVLQPAETPGGSPLVSTLRHFRFGGDLLDLIMLDTHSGRLSNETGFLGEAQHEWLDETLANSSSVSWRMFGQAKGFMSFSLNRAAEGLQLYFGIAFALAIFLLSTCVGSSVVVAQRRRRRNESQTLDLVAAAIGYSRSRFDTTEINYLEKAITENPRETWDFYPQDRERFFATLEARDVASNNLVASGDLHMTYFADIVPYDQDDADSLVFYDPETYAGKRYGENKWESASTL